MSLGSLSPLPTRRLGDHFSSGRGSRVRLGEMLISRGVISEDQLNQALQIQASEPSGRLGRLLVDLGHLTDAQLAEYLAEQFRLPWIRCADIEIGTEVLKLVSADLAQRMMCLPWRMEGRHLQLIVADPINLTALDAIGFAVGLPVKPVVAPEGEVVAALQRHYGQAQAELIESTLLPGERLDLADHLAVVEQVEADDAVTVEDLARAAHAEPVIRLVNGLIADAIESNASDIHIEPQERGVALRYRVDGALRHVASVPKRAHAKIASRIKIMAHLNIAERRRPQDGRARVIVRGRTFDLRISTLPTADGEKLVLRVLVQDRAQVPLEQLGFEPDTLDRLRSLLSQPQGLILVTGPTGSGKTTTLYSALNFLRHESRNIVTVEDPIEYRLPGVNQVAVSHSAGLSFAAGLRSILRQDPDIIMVGEIRDTETATVALQAAQTGHLVLSTLHTNDAPSTLSRLVDMGVPPYVVAASVTAVQAQRLVRRLCTCATPREDGTRPPRGCSSCRGTGFRGRMAVYELMPLTPSLRTRITSGAPVDELREHARREGMVTLYEDGARKAARGLTTLDEVKKVAPAPAAAARGTVLSFPRALPPPGSAETHGQVVLACLSPHGPHARTLERLGRLLDTDGIEMVAVDTCDALLDTARERLPSLVVIEHASGSDAFEQLARLAGPPGTSAPTLVLTADRSPAIEVALLDAGADDVRAAPVRSKLLAALIRRRLAARTPA